MKEASQRATYSASLRLSLAERAQEHAKKTGAPFCLSYGEQPAVCFEPFADGKRHGNFVESSYAAILHNPAWFGRFSKNHSHAGRSLPFRQDGTRAELDSCNSSDALLMNIFCYPGVIRRRAVTSLLGIEEGLVPEFGFKARVPLKNGRGDATEVDMKLGGLLVESKLTEGDFQIAPEGKVERYAFLEEVFDMRELRARLFAESTRNYRGYQLIRNVLAAHSLNLSFCVFYDARRPDLREQWFDVIACVKHSALRTRCKALTWQELSCVVGRELRAFLDKKYGI